LKNFFTINNIAYQLVPPYCHRCNAAERAIRTFKEHFVAGIFSVDPYFPMHLWNRLLPQAEITLNLLRTYYLHPQLSATAHYHGLVDYNKTAFAPPGAWIFTWSRHAPLPVSKCIHLDNGSERIVDTLEFFPHNYQMTQLSFTDRLLTDDTSFNDIHLER
jgi:hypothetical protein